MSVSVKKSNKRYIHIAIMFVLMFGMGFLPTFGQITPMGMKVLGVFIGLVYGWCFIDLTWTSILGFFALGITGAMGITEAFTSAFSNSTLVTVIVLCVFAEYLRQLGVNEAIAYWLMGKKCFLGRPWLLAIGLAVASILIGLAGGSFAGLFLLWGVIDVIKKDNQIEEGNLFLDIMFAVVLYGNVICQAHVPFQPGFILFTGFFNQATGLTIPSGQFLLIGLIYTFLLLILMIACARFILRADATKFLMSEERRLEYRNYKVSKIQKFSLVMLLIYFCALVFPSFLGNRIGVFGILREWGIIGISIIYMVVFSILPDEKGKSLVSMSKAFKEGVIWPTVVLLAVTIPLGDAMVSEDIGITATINEFCMAHLGGFSVLALEIVAIIVIGFLTQFLHNIVLGMVFIPILVPLATSMGGDPYVMFFAVHSALACSYATPAGCMQAGLIFGREDVPTKHASLSGWMLYIISCVVVVVMLPLVQILMPY